MQLLDNNRVIDFDNKMAPPLITILRLLTAQLYESVYQLLSSQELAISEQKNSVFFNFSMSNCISTGSVQKFSVWFGFLAKVKNACISLQINYCSDVKSNGEI
jgi:hypothetical protein